jgi:tetratricopeptide (TPR) repeat protein
MVKTDNHLAAKLTKRRLLLLSVVILLFILISLFVYLTYFHSTKSDKKNNQRSDVEILHDDEARTKGLEEQLLNKKDYEGYQNTVYIYFNAYYNRKEYTEAERIFSKITLNVPEDQINSSSYYKIAYLYKDKSDKANYSKYAKLLIERLKKEGKNQDAVAVEKDLKENQ